MPKTLREFGPLCRESYLIAKQRYRAIAVYLVFVAIVAALALPHSRGWLHAIQLPAESYPLTHDIAHKLSAFGELQYGTLCLSLLLWGAAAWSRRPDLRLAGSACFLSGIAAGIFVNILRPLFGRPRPSTGIADGFYYFTAEWSYNSFPSGHSMSNFASASALLIAYPPLGIPYFIIAIGIAWSRMQLNRHDPSDVTVGALLGIAVGLAFGLAARRLFNRGSVPSAPTAADAPNENGHN